MNRTPGIDVSRWQGEINWALTAAGGYRFAIIRATIGNYYTDPRFYANWNGARAAGLLVSAYHVVIPDRPADSQIARFFDVLGTRKADLPLVLDFESSHNCSPDEITACARDCLRMVAQRDERRPLIYTSRWFWDAQVSNSSEWAGYDLWVASYGVDAPLMPAGWDEWKFWQYSEKGLVPGITGNTDLDWFAGSYDDLLAYAHVAPQPEPRPSVGLRARVVAPRVNVRNGPGANYADLGDLHEGDVVNVVSITGKDVWVEFEPGKWAAFAFHGTQYLELE